MTEAPTAGQETSARRVAVLLGLLIALTVVGSSAVAVAVPVLRADLDLSVSDAAWIFSVYSLCFAVFTAVFGRLADLLGLRRPLVIGVSLMALGSAIAAAAPSLPILLAGRALQGIGSGAVPVLANGIIAARFSGAARARTFGTTFAVVSVVSGAGPIIGGGIETLASWRWVLAVPAVALLLIPSIIPLAGDDATPGRFDNLGALWTTLSVSGVLLLLQSPTAGATVAVPGLVMAVGSLPLLIRHVRRRPDGFLPLSVVADPTVRTAAVAGLTMLAGYFSALLAVPVLLHDLQGWSSLQIGAALLPAAAAGAIASRVVSRLVLRLDHFAVAAFVALLSTASLVIAALGHTVVILLVIGLAGGSIGFNGGNVALTDRVTRDAPDGTLGVTLGVVNMVQFIGGAVGAALLGGLSGLVSLSVALGITAALPAAGMVLLARSWQRGRSGGTNPG